ncbi:MAG TPA: ATP-binding protein, partial [Chroococcidiopsis sp.]
NISDRKQAEIALQELNQELEAKVAQRTATLQRQEAQLRNLSSRLELAVKSAQIGIWDWDIPNNHMVWDDRMCELYGIATADFPGNVQIWEDRLHPNDIAYAKDVLQQALAGERVFDPEFRIVLPNGTVRTIKAYALLQRNPQGQPLRMTGINYDISDRRLAEETLQKTNLELMRATRLKDEFLANMSHELRTPLNAILGMTEGLQEEVFGPINEAQRKALQTIERSSNHLLELINDILDLAKIEAGQVELHCAPTSIGPLCRSSLSFVKQQALKKQLELNLQVPQHLPDLLIDERRIRQVLINLLNNAVKFTPEGGSITLAVTLDSLSASSRHTTTPRANLNPVHHVSFAVIDTGIGIAPDDLERLFQPFIQVDSALNRQYQGTGLGLSLVKRIVEMHDGTVDVHSTVGVGSRFSFTLPCSEYVGPLPLATSPAAMPISIDAIDADNSAVPSSQLILLVEDNEANILTVSGYLKAKGYRLIVANNGQEAIALAQSEHPDLILMDIQMPGMDGFEAMRRIRQNPVIGDVPMIALTALAMSGDRDRCLAAGANDYIAKPIKLKQLAATIQQFLSS